MSSSDQTINLPQLLLILALGGLAIRYFFFNSSNPSTSHRGASSANNVRAREADVERIQQMFPQVSRRSIMWDLQRNGGNVVATTERILSGRGLEVVSLFYSHPGPTTCLAHLLIVHEATTIFPTPSSRPLLDPRRSSTSQTPPTRPHNTVQPRVQNRRPGARRSEAADGRFVERE